MDEHWFRYDQIDYAPPLDEWDNPMGQGRTDIYLTKYLVLKHTPKGVWLRVGTEWAADLELVPIKRFVLKAARKHFACPTEHDALESFIARKKAQQRILDRQIGRSEEAMRVAQRRLGIEPLPMEQVGTFDFLRGS